MEEHLKIHLLGGFLGSGKTTAIRQACRLLGRQGIAVGVITNDQGCDLVDSAYFASEGIFNTQVEKGCFCCRFEELENRISGMSAQGGPRVIFAESVGSCTDLVCTVVKPLSRFHPGLKVSLSIFADAGLLYLLLCGSDLLTKEVQYIYFNQLKEASLVIVSKTDLMESAERSRLAAMIKQKFGDKNLLFQDSFKQEDLQRWLDALDKNQPCVSSQSPDIDYDVYAQGESQLAWLDQYLEIRSPHLDATHCAHALIREIYKKIKEIPAPIVHLKFFVNGRQKISFTTMDQAEDPFPEGNETGLDATLLVNARVQTSPERLRSLVAACLQMVATSRGCVFKTISTDVFSPGYPKPTFRIA